MDAAGFPPLYGRWLSEFLGPVPRETRATCDDCPLCAGPEGPSAIAPFDRELKCCTFYPTLPNFLVGAALDDPDVGPGALRAAAEAGRAAGAIVSPLGVGPTSRKRLDLVSSEAPFGQDGRTRCPYLQSATDARGPRCGIWRHREAICTTWFCRHDRGPIGQAFWFALHGLLSLLEFRLRWWCVVRSGLQGARLEHLAFLQCAESEARGLGIVPAELRLDDSGPFWDPTAEGSGAWFRRSAAMVAALDWAGALRIGGDEAAAKSREVESAFARLCSSALPLRLELGRYTVIARGGAWWLATYRSYDPTELPADLAQDLPWFRGRTSAEAIERLATRWKVPRPERVLRALLDHGVLGPTAEGCQPGPGRYGPASASRPRSGRLRWPAERSGRRRAREDEDHDDRSPEGRDVEP